MTEFNNRDKVRTEIITNKDEDNVNSLVNCVIQKSQSATQSLGLEKDG